MLKYIELSKKEKYIMIHTLDTIMSEYYQRVDIYKKMQHDVEDIINTLIEAHQIKISTMSLRIKSEQALRNKIISKDKYHHLEDITDVLGCRILTLFESDVERILELLEDTFEVCEIVDKRKKANITALSSVTAPSIWS